MDERKLNQWLKERNKAVLSCNVQMLKSFYYKWSALGVYQIKTLPSDKVIEISMRKMILTMKDATPEQKEEAKKWLLERGYSPEP
jgi:hypothetical protein